MTTLRPTQEFEALGFDPAPGDLGMVESCADQYRRVSKQLEFAMNSIDSIIKQRGIWEGEASQAFARRVGDLPKYLDKATQSMSRASSALSQWQGSLGDMQRRAEELEHQAKRARAEAEQARSNPAFELAGQTFHDPESLQAAQRALDNAARQLTQAIDNLDAVMTAARRLHEQHTEVAERIAELIKVARDIAPDEPGWLSRQLENLADWAADRLNDFIDFHEQLFQAVGDWLEDNANLIAAVSDILGDIGAIVGTIGDFIPPPVGTVVSGVGLAFSGAALGGYHLARHHGADVPDEKIALATAGVVLGAVGMIPGTPPGMGLAFDVGWEAAARASGEDGGTTIGKFIPRNDRQWMQLGAGVLFPPAAPLAVAVGAENMANDWVSGVSDAKQADAAGQADRDQARAERDVWR